MYHFQITLFKFTGTAALLSALAIASILGCSKGQQPPGSNGSSSSGELFPEIGEMVSASQLDELRKSSPDNELARYLAGKSGDGGPAYQQYVAQLNKIWQSKVQPNLAQIEKWRLKTLAPKVAGAPRTLLYPFGGPDLLNALAFFPDMDNYILMALETPGPFPGVAKLKKAQGKSAAILQPVQTSLSRIMTHNFFFTKMMTLNIGSSDYTGMNALYAFFLGRLGYKVLKIIPIRVNKKGKLISAEKDKDTIQWENIDWKTTPTTPRKVLPVGVVILFEDSEGRLRRLIYVQTNLADINFHPGKPSYELMGRINQRTVMFKAASYLMFSPKFDTIRHRIMENSSYIFQDSSGIPYHYLTQPKGTWDIHLFGSYTKPINLFENHCQPDLALAMVERPAPQKTPLKFAFGYTSASSLNTHMMLAIKTKAINTIHQADKDPEIGQRTVCDGDQRVINTQEKGKPLKISAKKFPLPAKK